MLHRVGFIVSVCISQGQKTRVNNFFVTPCAWETSIFNRFNLMSQTPTRDQGLSNAAQFIP